MLLSLLLMLSAAAVFPNERSSARNLDVLAQLCREIMEQLPSAAEEEAVLINRQGTPRPVDWLIEKEAAATLQQRGLSVYLSAPVSESRPMARLEYLPIKSDIEYRRIGKKKFVRSVSLSLHLRYLAADGRLLFDAVENRAAEDTLAFRPQRLEDASLDFTRGENRRSAAARTIEVAAATALTAAIVLLFYFYRSH